MESIENINKKILLITAKIKEQHPELIHFLNEMPVTIPNCDNPEINLKSLADYHQSLVLLKEKYMQYLNIKEHD